jgi:hypothetical protein
MRHVAALPLQAAPSTLHRVSAAVHQNSPVADNLRPRMPCKARCSGTATGTGAVGAEAAGAAACATTEARPQVAQLRATVGAAVGIDVQWLQLANSVEFEGPPTDWLRVEDWTKLDTQKEGFFSLAVPLQAHSADFSPGKRLSLFMSIVPGT